MATAGAIGSETRQLDSRDKITGQLKYAGDLQIPGMLHGRLVVSPYAHARIKSIDASEAEKIPGVIVVTAKDLPIANPGPNRAGEPLARDEVLFNGHPVAVVLAPSAAIAEDAVGLVEVDYE